MSTYARASGGDESGRLEGRRTEDVDEENINNSRAYTQYLKAVRPRPRSANLAGEERSIRMEQVVSPAFPRGKVQRKTCSMDSRGRSREGNQDEDEVRENAEHVSGRERGILRPRKIEGTEKHADGAPDRRGRGSRECPSSSSSEVQSSTLEDGEGANSHGGQTRLKSQSNGCASVNRAKTSPQHPGPTRRFTSPIAQPLVQTRSTPLRPPPRLTTEDHDVYPFRSPRAAHSFWAEMRSGGGTELSSQNPHRTQSLSPTSLEPGEEEEEKEDEDLEDDEEESNGATVTMNQTVTPASALPCVPFGESRISKRERNRIKCLRRRQRRRERWRQTQPQESRQSSPGTPSISSSENEDTSGARDREGYICAVCLDVYFSPYMCHPCNHIFCEPCLRTLAKDSPTNTPCPLCRTTITQVFFQKGFQGPSSLVPRRQVPHGAGYRLDAMDFPDDSGGWRLDMNMVIIYIFSVNWVIGFFILCFIGYVFFPSF